MVIYPATARCARAPGDACHGDQVSLPGRAEHGAKGEGVVLGDNVREGFCSAGAAQAALIWGGCEMANAPGREPWTLEEVRDVVRRGLLAGYTAV
jgi:hypothetical protein